jgi:hypothetical protein
MPTSEPDFADEVSSANGEWDPPWTPPPPEMVFALRQAERVRRSLPLLKHRKARVRDRARRRIFSIFLWALQQQGVLRAKE